MRAGRAKSLLIASLGQWALGDRRRAQLDALRLAHAGRRGGRIPADDAASPFGSRPWLTRPTRAVAQ